jgi:hypothetical protein
MFTCDVQVLIGILYRSDKGFVVMEMMFTEKRAKSHIAFRTGTVKA